MKQVTGDSAQVTGLKLGLSLTPVTRHPSPVTCPGPEAQR